MTRKGGLGKGLDALIPGGGFDSHPSPSSAAIQNLAIEQVRPNPRQPRTHFDAEQLAELAESIREHGILQPLLVTRDGQTDQYILIAGERRLQAAGQAGLRHVPVIVREATQQELVELALIENIQRADLNPLETAEAYHQLVNEFHLAHEQIATRVGKSRATVTNTLRLLKLPPAVQQALTDGKISEGHARTLLALATSQAQFSAMQTIIKNNLNVRQSEELVRKLSGEKPPAVLKKANPPEINALEERLRQRLGTKVTINQKRKGGTLVLHYYSDEELDSLMQRLLPE